MSTLNRIVRWLTGEEEGEDREAQPVDSEPVAEAPVRHQSRQDAPSSAIRSIAASRLVRSGVESNAEPYGVTVEEASVEPGAEYWRAVRVYHLAPHENKGRHHIFIDVLTPDGQRDRNSRVRIQWDGGEQTVPVDKPDTEPGANFPMWKWQVCSVQVLGLPSDTVRGLRTNHPDEPNPDGTQSGNTLFHHSFLVVFQKTKAPEATGTIIGRVENHREGLSVQLVRNGAVVESVPLSASGSFTFTIHPGRYEIRVDDQVQPVTVAGGDTVQVVLTLTQRNSIIEGIVHGGNGLLLRLVLQGEVLAEGALGPSGSFRLRNLRPGDYFLQVVQPNSIQPLVQAGPLTMDGRNVERVELRVPSFPATEAASPLDHYVLLGAPDQPATRTQLTLLAPILAEKQLTFGFHMHEAAHARRVTVIGDGHSVPEFALIYLVMQGVQVERLTGTAQEIRTQLRQS